MDFEEEIFIVSLINRSEDARRFCQTFKPQWLKSSEYSPILNEIYEFTKKTGEAPSFQTLHKIIKDKDPNSYELRYKSVLEKLSSYSPDKSEMIYTVDQAMNIAIVRSFRELCNDESMLLAENDIDGEKLVDGIQKWMAKLTPVNEDRTMNLRQAVDTLVQGSEFITTNVRIPTGITPLDDWSGGGLRKKQLAIYIAPTGQGKSAILLIIGYKIATIERKNVWIVSNELPIEEYAERSLARLNTKGIVLDKIIENPAIAYENLEYQWKQDLHKRVYITEYNRETSTDDLLADMERLRVLNGWKPDVIILDYMERMKPSIQGYKRGDEWQWYGAIAKDLVRFAKKHNILIWTAAQTNRAGLTAKDIDLSMGQGSIRHFQEAHLVVSGKQIDIPNSDDIGIKMTQHKARGSKRSSRPVVLRCNLAKMSITNEEIEEEDDT